MQKSYTLLWICGLVLAAAVGFFASSVVFCHKNPEPPTAPEFAKDKPQNEWHAFKKQRHFNFKHKMDSALGLSKEQIAKLDSNGRACNAFRREISRQIRLAEQELHTLLKADIIDEAALQSTRAKLLLLNEKRLDQRIQDVKFFKSVLTAEQHKKFKDQPSKFDQMPPRVNRMEQMQGEHPKMDYPNMEGPRMGPPPQRDGAHNSPPCE